MTLASLRWKYYGGGLALAAIAVGAVLGTIFLAVGYFVRQTEEEYVRNGVASTATVTRKDQRIETRPAGQKGGPKTVYTLHYRYRDDQAQAHDGGGNVDANIWNQFQKDQPLKIEYLRDQPGTSRITEGRSFLARWGYLLALGGGGLLLGGVLVFGIGGWFWAGRKARLVCSGVPFLGTVTNHDTRSSGRRNQEPSCRLRFMFTDAAGTELTGKSCWLPQGLAPQWPINEPILVLQNPDEPARFEADIFRVRADDLSQLQSSQAQE